MDKAVFVRKLKNIFLNLEDKKYSKVWLSEANYGGLYRSGHYLVNLKFLPDFNEEITYISKTVHMLFDKLDKEQITYVERVAAHPSYEDYYSEPNDIVLYNDEPVYG